MSNDLISRSALMQALRGNALVDVTPNLEQAIAKQPTVYDVNRVVKHDLKTLPEYFEAVISGKKNFELRKNDRDYKVGDMFALREWEPEKGYTGRDYVQSIGYILKDCPEYGLMDGYIIFGW